jgi:hypothetical protein
MHGWKLATNKLEFSLVENPISMTLFMIGKLVIEDTYDSWP